MAAPAAMSTRSFASNVRTHGLLVGLLLAIAACSPGEWQPLTVSDGGFTVLMRGQPGYDRQRFETPAGAMEAHLYSSDQPQSYFAVGYTDYPLALVVGAAPDELFSGVRETWLRRIRGEVVTARDTAKLSGAYPGYEFTAKGTLKEQDVLVRGRMYVVEQRLYQLIATGPPQEVAHSNVTRFFDSFRLVTPEEAAQLQLKNR
jgi:hypothetical protein